MEPRFSEFSYGYAVTEELANGVLGAVKGHPIFPSLKKEGQVGGGYDVKLPLVGAPLYLQFKRSHFLKRVYSEHWELFNSPFYRMYLIRSKYSMQHELLIYLELSGNEVYYIAPEFYTDDELTEYYTNKHVFYCSALFSPSDIGHLPDEDQHYVAFNRNPNAYFCSKEPRILERALKGESFTQSYISTSESRRKKINEAFFDEMIDNTMRVLEERFIKTDILKKTRAVRTETLGDKARFAAYLTRAYFDTELFIVGE